MQLISSEFTPTRRFASVYVCYYIVSSFIPPRLHPKLFFDSREREKRTHPSFDLLRFTMIDTNRQISYIERETSFSNVEVFAAGKKESCYITTIFIQPLKWFHHLPTPPLHTPFSMSFDYELRLWSLLPTQDSPSYITSSSNPPLIEEELHHSLEIALIHYSDTRWYSRMFLIHATISDPFESVARFNCTTIEWNYIFRW